MANGGSSDEIERLLREVEAVTGGGSGANAGTPAPARAGRTDGKETAGAAGHPAALRWATVSAIGAGVLVFLLFGALPFLRGIDGGLGAAGAAFVAVYALRRWRR